MQHQQTSNIPYLAERQRRVEQVGIKEQWLVGVQHGRGMAKARKTMLLVKAQGTEVDVPTRLRHQRTLSEIRRKGQRRAEKARDDSCIIM